MASARSREIAVSVFWVGAVCLWWCATPGLLGMEIPHPVLVLGLASTVPLLVLRTAFRLLELARGTRPIEGLPRLGGATFAVLLAAAFLCAALMVSHVSGIGVAASVALIFVSLFGILGVTVSVFVLVFATTEPTGRSFFEGQRRCFMRRRAGSDRPDGGRLSTPGGSVAGPA